jgi:hypothetical protein
MSLYVMLDACLPSPPSLWLPHSYIQVVYTPWYVSLVCAPLFSAGAALTTLQGQLAEKAQALAASDRERRAVTRQMVAGNLLGRLQVRSRQGSLYLPNLQDP